MNKMVARFFFYIWGALVGTFMLVVVMAIALDQRPPGTIRFDHISAIIERAVQQAWSERGAAGLDALMSESPGLSLDFTVMNASSCAGQITITKLDDGCLILYPTGQTWGMFGPYLPFALPIGVGTLASLLVALMLARRFVRPIERIGGGLTALSKGDLAQRISPDLTFSEPAIADVGRAFDLAAEKLQELTEGRSRLFHDISHEIRSPLARLQAALALLRHSPEQPEQMMVRMEGDIARIDRLLTEVLTLARLEWGAQTELQRQSLDLIDLLDPILEGAKLEGGPLGIRIEYDGPEALILPCDPELLHRALENIIRNALRFSPEGGRLSLRVSSDDADVRITINDQGPGVSEEQLPHLFDAFMRGSEGSGAGLGLAIASQSVRLHGGSLKAENLRPTGLSLTINLPRQSD